MDPPPRFQGSAPSGLAALDAGGGGARASAPPRPRSGTRPGSACASLHVTLLLGEHGGGHRVSAAPGPGHWPAARRGGLGLQADSPRRRAAAPLVVLCGRGQRASSRGAGVGAPGGWQRAPRLGQLSSPVRCPVVLGPTLALRPQPRAWRPRRVAEVGARVCRRVRGHAPQLGGRRCPVRGWSAPGRRWCLRRAPTPFPNGARPRLLQGPNVTSEKLSHSTYPTFCSPLHLLINFIVHLFYLFLFSFGV